MSINYLDPGTGAGTIKLASDVAATEHRQIVVLGNQTAAGAGLMPGNTTTGLFVDVRALPAINPDTTKQGANSIINLPLNFASSGDNSVKAAVSGKKIRVLSVWMIPASAVNVSMKSGAGSTIIGAFALPVGGLLLNPGDFGWVMETGVNAALIFNLSSAVQIRGFVNCIEIA